MKFFHDKNSFDIARETIVAIFLACILSGPREKKKFNRFFVFHYKNINFFFAMRKRKKEFFVFHKKERKELSVKAASDDDHELTALDS